MRRCGEPSRRKTAPASQLVLRRPQQDVKTRRKLEGNRDRCPSGWRWDDRQEDQGTVGWGGEFGLQVLKAAELAACWEPQGHHLPLPGALQSSALSPGIWVPALLLVARGAEPSSIVCWGSWLPSAGLLRLEQGRAAAGGAGGLGACRDGEGRAGRRRCRWARAGSFIALEASFLTCIPRKSAHAGAGSVPEIAAAGALTPACFIFRRQQTARGAEWPRPEAPRVLCESEGLLLAAGAGHVLEGLPRLRPSNSSRAWGVSRRRGLQGGSAVAAPSPPSCP